MGCQVCPYIKTGLYTLDVGTDIYNTVQYGIDCHYKLFAISLMLIIGPNVLYGGMVSFSQGLKKGIKTLFFLHFVTVMELWTDNFDKERFPIPDGKSVEVIFESFPQFCIQCYVFFLFGFGFSNNHGNSFWSLFTPGVRVFGIVTSLLSVLHGINCHIVASSSIKTKFSQINILKCSLYTLPDLLMRLLFFPISWTLIGNYTILVMIFLFIMAVITAEILFMSSSSGSYYFSFYWAMGINVAPQVSSPYSKLFIWGKIISNPLFLILTIFFNICLLAMEPMSNSFMDTDRLVVRSTTTNICKATSSYQSNIFINTDIIAFILIPVIYTCIVLSSLEIIFHFCLREKWTKWRDEYILQPRYPEIVITAPEE